MVMIYTSIEGENDCFEDQIVKIQKFKIRRVRSLGQNHH